MHGNERDRESQSSDAHVLLDGNKKANDEDLADVEEKKCSTTAQSKDMYSILINVFI